MIDPLWWVTVEQGHGLTAREWDVGHFNGVAGDYEPASVARDGPHRLRMTTASGEDFLVDLDRTLPSREPPSPWADLRGRSGPPVSVGGWTYGKMGCICPPTSCRTVSLG